MSPCIDSQQDFIPPTMKLEHRPDLVPRLVQQSWERALEHCYVEKGLTIQSHLVQTINALHWWEKTQKMKTAVCICHYEKIWQNELEGLSYNQISSITYWVQRHSSCEDEHRKVGRQIWERIIGAELGVNLAALSSVSNYMGSLPDAPSNGAGICPSYYTRFINWSYQSLPTDLSSQQKKLIKIARIAMMVVATFFVASCAHTNSSQVRSRQTRKEFYELLKEINLLVCQISLRSTPLPNSTAMVSY